jgi:hypothetical protein
MNGKGLLFLMRDGNPQSAMFVVQVLWEIVVLASVFTIKASSEYIASLWLLLNLLKCAWFRWSFDLWNHWLQKAWEVEWAICIQERE